MNGPGKLSPAAAALSHKRVLNLMTTVCDELIKSLSQEERVIPAALVKDVLVGFQVQNQLGSWGDLDRDSPGTSRDGYGNAARSSRGSLLDCIVVYSTAHADAFTFRDITAPLQTRDSITQPTRSGSH
jgi:hypothetical protein